MLYAFTGEESSEADVPDQEGKKGEQEEQCHILLVTLVGLPLPAREEEKRNADEGSQGLGKEKSRRRRRRREGENLLLFFMSPRCECVRVPTESALKKKVSPVLQT